MLIDWFTVAAQAVNFLVLVWLLRRFLYQPISRSMAERQQRIDDRLAQAARMRDEATVERERLSAELERLSAERDERARRMREELDATRRASLEQARAEVDALQVRWREAVQREKEGFLVELRQRIGEEVVAVVRRALADLADESLEVRVASRFIDELEHLEAGQRQALSSAAAADGGRLHLRSAFDLPGPVRDRVAESVRGAVGSGCEPQFEVAPGLVGGLELRAGGYVLAWSFDDYLGSLGEALAAAFGEEAQDIGDE